MRTLETTDLFKAFRLVIKLGVREEITEVMKRAEESKTKKVKMDMSFDLFLGILEKAVQEKGEKEIYIFFADLLERTPEEVGKMHPIKLFEELEQVASIEEWKNFFKYVAKLIRKK